MLDQFVKTLLGQLDIDTDELNEKIDAFFETAARIDERLTRIEEKLEGYNERKVIELKRTGHGEYGGN